MNVASGRARSAFELAEWFAVVWPNVWGQLWYCAQTDLAQSMDQLRVVGEVWAEKQYGTALAIIESLSLRETIRRDPRAPAFDRFFSALFDIYTSGGRRGTNLLAG